MIVDYCLYLLRRSEDCFVGGCLKRDILFDTLNFLILIQYIFTFVGYAKSPKRLSTPDIFINDFIKYSMLIYDLLLLEK